MDIQEPEGREPDPRKALRGLVAVALLVLAVVLCKILSWPV